MELGAPEAGIRSSTPPLLQSQEGIDANGAGAASQPATCIISSNTLTTCSCLLLHLPLLFFHMQLIGGLTLYRHLKKTIDIVQLIVFYEKNEKKDELKTHYAVLCVCVFVCVLELLRAQKPVILNQIFNPG